MHKLSAFIAMLLLTFAAHAAPVMDKQLTINCPATMVQEAGHRLAQLESTQQHLANFISGKGQLDSPPSALFIVDLQDEPAIQARIRELQGFRTQGQSSARLSPELVNCAKHDAALAALIDKIQAQQQLLDSNRLGFLSLPAERRSTLLNAQLNVQAHASSAAQFADERNAANQLQTRAAESIVNAEELSKVAASKELRAIAAHRALLEKTRENMARIQSEMATGLQTRAEFYQRTSETLSELAAAAISQKADVSLPKSYLATTEIWRDLVDRTFDRIATPASHEAIPSMPAEPMDLLARLKDNPEAMAYREAYRETSALKLKLQSIWQQRLEEERAGLYRLLLEAGRLRSELINRNIQNGHAEILAISPDYFADIGREVRIVPYRALAFLYSKAVDFRQKADAGITGWFSIAKQIIIFLVFLAIPFAVFALLRRAVIYLNLYRRHLVSIKHNHPYAGSLAIWIQRINAYVPWAVMLLGVRIAEDLVVGSDIAEIGIILPYIALYLWYRIFVNFMSSLVGVVAYSGILERAHVEEERMRRTSKLVGIFFFVILALLHAAQDVVGEAIVYRLVQGIAIYFGTLVCAYTARQWRKEVSQAAKQMLPELLFNKVQLWCENAIWSWLVCLPLLLLLIAAKFLTYFKIWTANFDFSKKISAALFLRRIKQADKHDEASVEQPPALPQEYLKWFNLYALKDDSVLIEPSTGITSELEAIVHAWLNNPFGDHSLALYGEKGSGKSSLLDILERTFKECTIRRISIPPKLYSREAVLNFFSKELGMDLQKDSFALQQADEGMQNTLMLIDDAHNLFLGKLGGFEGYQAFAELMNSNTRHIFWCATFNRHSWEYLSAFFGGMPLFRKAVAVNAFSDTDIKKLVIARHRHSHFQLVYDAIIQAAQGEGNLVGKSHVENQFFRLLWGQSNGNPRVAQLLWTGSLTPLPGNRLKVGLPQFPKIHLRSSWSDEALFLYAAIFRHENLSAGEAVPVTSLPENNVIHTLNVGCADNLLDQSEDGRYRIKPTAQASIAQILIGKNFLYE